MFKANRTSIFAIILFSCLWARSAGAAVYQYSATLTDAPVFDSAGPAGFGSHNYNAFEFSTAISGTYSFIARTATYDNFTILYSEEFDPSNYKFNRLISNDDLGSSRASGFDFQLEPGKKYIFVNIGRAPQTMGDFTAAITGPGLVMPIMAAVPEPETYAMLLAGVGAIGMAVRRHRRRVMGFSMGRRPSPSPA